jgi:uncharacterized protein
MRLVLTTDTHLPKRARDLPAPLWSAIDEADVVFHAGDWVDEATLDAFESRATHLIACYGNNDGPGLRARLPEIAYATVAGLRVAVLHDSGQSTGRTPRMVARFPEVDLLVFGHSHIPVGHDRPVRPALAQSRLPDRPAAPAPRDLHDGDGHRRRPG